MRKEFRLSGKVSKSRLLASVCGTCLAMATVTAQATAACAPGGFEIVGPGVFAGQNVVSAEPCVLITNSATLAGDLNLGTIIGEPISPMPAVEVSNSVIMGGFFNTGSILAGSNVAVRIEGSVVQGGLSNSGTILSDLGDGISVSASSLLGGLNNTGAIISNGDAIYMDAGVTFSGGITNSGRLEAGNDAIRLEGSAFQNGILNGSGGVILAGGTGIDVDNDTFGGGITNVGTIVTGPSGTNVRGIDIDVGTFAGGLSNSGTIISNFTGVEVDATTFSGGVQSSGLVEGLERDGFNFDVTTFNGGFLNTGTIMAGDVGVYLAATSFNGGISNSGIISNGTEGVSVSATVFNGGITNSGSISGSSSGVRINATSFNGGITNSGTIDGGSGFGLRIDATNFVGNLNHTGSIFGETGINLEVSVFTGNVFNVGETFGSSFGLQIQNSFVTGSLTNSGLAKASAGTAIGLFNSTLDGALVNSGTAHGSDTGVAIALSNSHVAGGILNTGTVLAGTALDLSTASAGVTYLQSGPQAHTSGNIRLENGNADQLNFNGGSYGGTISGDPGGSDTLNTNAGSGFFSFVEGVASNLNAFNVVSGTAVLGTTTQSVNGSGATITGLNSLSVATGATLHLDNDASVVVENTVLAAGSTLSLFLTPSTAAGTYPSIEATNAASINGSLSIFLDTSAFGASPTSQYIYSGVIKSDIPNGLTGSFSNVSIQSANPLFDVAVEYHSESVDIVLERISFTAFAIQNSLNQQNVASRLDERIASGVLGPELTNLYNYLLSLPSTDQIPELYDRLSGATHAQEGVSREQAVINLERAVRERQQLSQLPGCVVAGLGGCLTRYAQAGSATASDAEFQGMSLPGARVDGALTVWGKMLYSRADSKGDLNAAGIVSETNGMLAGVDTNLARDFLVGVGLQLAETNSRYDRNSDTSKISTVQLSTYTSWGLPSLSFSAAVDGVWQSTISGRDISLGTTAYRAESSYESLSVRGSGSVSSVMEWSALRFEPSLSVNASSQFTDGYVESGAGGLGLTTNSTSANSLSTTLSAQLARSFAFGNDQYITPAIRLAWTHEFLNNTSGFTADFNDAGSDPNAFSVVGEATKRDSGTVGVGIVANVLPGVVVSVDGSHSLSSTVNSSSLSGGVRVSF